MKLCLLNSPSATSVWTLWKLMQLMTSLSFICFNYLRSGWRASTGLQDCKHAPSSQYVQKMTALISCTFEAANGFFPLIMAQDLFLHRFHLKRAFPPPLHHPSWELCQRLLLWHLIIFASYLLNRIQLMWPFDYQKENRASIRFLSSIGYNSTGKNSMKE